MKVQRRYILWLIASLVFGALMLTIDRTALYPLLDKVAEEFSLSNAQSGAIASVYFLFLMISQVPVGFLGDRLGFKRFLVGFYALGGLSLLGLGFLTHSYSSLLLFVALQGFGLGVFWPIAYSLIMLTVPARRRGMASSFVTGGLAAGHAVGLGLSAYMYEATGSWSLPFILLAVPTLVIVVVFAVVLREPSQTTSRPTQTQWGLVLKDSHILRIYFAGFCSLYCFWLVIVWGPSFLQAERGFSLTASGLLIGVVTAAAIPSGLIAGPLSDRIGRKPVSVVMLTLSAIAIVFAGITSQGVWLIVALIGYGLVGKFAWDPVVISWLAEYADARYPQRMGFVITLFSIAGMTSSVIAPLVSGAIRDATGSLTGAFFIASGLVALGALAVSTLPEKPQRQTS